MLLNHEFLVVNIKSLRSPPLRNICVTCVTYHHVSLVEQKLLPFLSTWGFRCLILILYCFVNHCLSFSSLVILVLVLSVCRFTSFDYPFGIFILFLIRDYYVFCILRLVLKNIVLKYYMYIVQYTYKLIKDKLLFLKYIAFHINRSNF
jgi:hypothetical protein